LEPYIYIEHFVILFFKVIPSHKNLVQPISPPKRKREREKQPKIEKKELFSSKYKTYIHGKLSFIL